MDTIVEHLPFVLQDLFCDAPDQLNRDIGFSTRERKITPCSFVRTLVFGWLNDPEASIADLAEYASDILGCPYSESSLNERFTPQAVSLLDSILDQALTHLIEGAPLPSPLLSRFQGVFIFDTSVSSFPSRLARYFPGCGNQLGLNAACKILFGFELTRGGLVQLDLFAARNPDQTLADYRFPVPEGSLTICDLGFFGLERFTQQQQLGNFWFTRAHPQLVIKLPQGGTGSILDFLRGRGWQVDEAEVEIGSKHKLRCRLIAWRVPDQVAERRKRKRVENQNRKSKRKRKAADRANKKGKRCRGRKRQGCKRKKEVASLVTAEQLEWCEWVVVLTNVGSDKMSVSEAEALLRGRWQIELVIKVWKGFGGLERMKGRKKERVECELLAKLLGQLVAHWALLSSGVAYLELSVTRGSKQVRKYAERIGKALGVGEKALREVLAELAKRIAASGRRQRRKKDPNTAQRLCGERPPWFSDFEPKPVPWFDTSPPHRRSAG